MCSGLPLVGRGAHGRPGRALPLPSGSVSRRGASPVRSLWMGGKSHIWAPGRRCWLRTEGRVSTPSSRHGGLGRPGWQGVGCDFELASVATVPWAPIHLWHQAARTLAGVGGGLTGGPGVMSLFTGAVWLSGLPGICASCLCARRVSGTFLDVPFPRPARAPGLGALSPRAMSLPHQLQWPLATERK